MNCERCERCFSGRVEQVFMFSGGCMYPFTEYDWKMKFSL